MNIAEIIASLVGGASPNRAVMDANAAIPPSGLPQQAPPPMPAPVAAPVGIQTPVTNPAAPSEVPKAMQSPPDLANMYIELMKKNQNAAALDSGMNMIAAGLSKYPENRAALLAASGRGGGGMTLSGSDIVNMQKQQTEMQNRLVRQSMLGGLAKQYKMSPHQIQYLESSNKLDEVIKHYSTENLGVVEDKSTGQHVLFNQRTGKEITRLGGEKPEETQFVNGPQGPELRSKVTNERVGEPVGLPPDKVAQQQPDGTYIIVDKNAPAGTVIGAREQVGDKIIPAQNELAAINQARVARGEAPMTAEELIKLKQTPPTQINVGQDGSIFQKPPPGYEWRRGPDGKIITNEKGEASYYKVKEGPAADEAAEAQRKLDKEQVKEAKAKVQATFAASNVGLAIDQALKHVDTPGVVGYFSKTIRGIPSPGGLPHDKFDAAMSTISANVAFEALRQMRASSPTGGALGQVSDFENRMLRDVITPLASYGDAKDMRKGLIRVKAAMEILADDNFGNDPVKFMDALKKRTQELDTTPDTTSKSGSSIRKLN